MDWKPIGTHVGKYEVSSRGEVRQTGGRSLKLWLSDQGYVLARLSGPRVVARVHRLVATAFVPNPLKLPFVNHIDCNKANNCASNLEWCTQQENLAHSSSLGRMPRNYWKGKRSPNAALTEEQAAEIRREYSNGGISMELLGKKHGISKRTIGRVVSGQSYV